MWKSRSAPAGQLDLELVDDEEVVVRRVLEVDEPHRLRAALLPVGKAIGHRALEQKFRGRLVDLHQPMPGSLFQIANGFGDSRLIEPRLAVPQVELPQRRGEPPLEQHLAEVLPLGQLWHIRVALEPLPAHRFELLAEGLLDEVVFPLGLHVAIPVAKCRDSCREFVTSLSQPMARFCHSSMS